MDGWRVSILWFLPRSHWIWPGVFCSWQVPCQPRLLWWMVGHWVGMATKWWVIRLSKSKMTWHLHKSDYEYGESNAVIISISTCSNATLIHFLKITSLATFFPFHHYHQHHFTQKLWTCSPDFKPWFAKKEGSSCAICLDKSDANEAVPWVQLPCEHVLHRKCFQELVSFLGIEGWNEGNQEMTVWGWGSRLGHFWWQGVGRWFENTGCLCEFVGSWWMWLWWNRLWRS